MKNVVLKILILFLLLTFHACAQFKKEKNTEMKELVNKPENPYYSNTDTKKINLTDAEWKKILPKNLYEVARHAATEPAFTGKMWQAETKGTYYCAACGYPLFKSNQKFISSCGWPSFFEQDNKESIIFKPDNSYGMQRTEALCGRCNSHLGHLFDDGPQPTGKRYCMNAISLDFVSDDEVSNKQTTNKIVLGGGCFWCIEAIYKELKGVQNVVSGYAGGKVKNPSYEEVSTGKTGAAEVVEITYNSKELNLKDILKIFFTIHDPTTLNKQGADLGTQYRSVIFYENEEQKNIAKKIIDNLNQNKVYDNPVVTSLELLENFYKAEDYHQNYYSNNKNQTYCKLVIQPKIEKFEKIFKENLKK